MTETKTPAVALDVEPADQTIRRLVPFNLVISKVFRVFEKENPKVTRGYLFGADVGAANLHWMAVRDVEELKESRGAWRELNYYFEFNSRSQAMKSVLSPKTPREITTIPADTSVML